MRCLKQRKNLTVVLLAGSILLCGGCKKKTTVGEAVSGQMSDMSGYPNFADQDTHIFYDMTVREMAEAMDAKKTFAVYFGYDTCEWCLDAVPVINDAAKDSNQTVGYINTRANPSWQKNTDIDDYDLLVEKVGTYLEFDDAGVRHLYVPSIFFIREGEVVEFHEGTLEGHNAKNRAMTAEERGELHDILVQKFAVMNGETGSSE